MTKRINSILLMLLIVQVALVLNAFWSSSTGDRPVTALIEGLDVPAVTTLEFSSEDGKALGLERGSEGGWRIPALDGYPADSKKVEAFIEKLEKLDTRMVVASTRSAQTRLQVAENKYNRKVSLATEGADRSFTLFIGSSPSQGQLHIRLEGDDRVYLTRALSAWEASPESSSWIDREYIKIPPGDLLSVELENANGRLRFEKADDGAWTIPGLAERETVASETVDVLINRLSTVRMQDVLGKSEEATYGLQNPEVITTLAYRNADDDSQPGTLTLVASVKDEAKSSHVVKSSGSPFYVTVPAYALREAVEAKRDDYVAGISSSVSQPR